MRGILGLLGEKIVLHQILIRLLAEIDVVYTKRIYRGASTFPNS